MVEVMPLMQGLYFGDGDIRADIEAKYGPQGDLLEIYTTTTGSHVHEWHHYLPLYEHYFGPWRKPGLRFLEIGVSRGGSLAMWRRCFGPEAVTFGVDVVLEDRSHMMAHIEASLHALFPRLPMDGVYMIEDLHAAYWPECGGGLNAPANVFNTLRRMVDDMHHWYHDGGVADAALAVTGLHIHDSLVVPDKAPVHRPTHSIVGGAVIAKTARVR